MSCAASINTRWRTRIPTSLIIGRPIFSTVQPRPGVLLVGGDAANSRNAVELASRLTVTVASSFGILPATIDNTLNDCFRPAHCLDHVHRAQPVSRRAGSRPALPIEPGFVQQHLC